MKRATIIFFLVGAFILFWQLFYVYEKKSHIPVVIPLPLPASALKIISLGHDQAAAQTLYFKVMFYNEFRAEKDKLPVDLETTFAFVDTATQLDIYNMDCYYYGQALFSDQMQYVEPFNSILERGAIARTWDHYLPWFLGVNYYFTLGDKKKAGDYFLITAKRKPNNPFFTTLASRAFYEGNETELAVMILEEMIINTSSPVVADQLKTRMTAFQTVLFLENCIKDYKKRFAKLPTSIDDLVSGAILTKVPPDPYGGEFYLSQDGRVQSTSKFAFPKDKK